MAGPAPVPDQSDATGTPRMTPPTERPSTTSPAPPILFERLPHDRQVDALSELARLALPRWGLAPTTTVRLVNLTENATFRVDDEDGETFALRIHRDGYHETEDVRSELAWLMALRRDGVVTTPVPVPGLDGQLIQHLALPSMANPRKIVLSRWESGVEPGIGDDLGRPFEILGEVTARMHLHARSWDRPPGFRRHVWSFDTSIGERPHWGRWRDGMGMTPARIDLFGRTARRIRERLDAFGDAPDRFGLVHGDLRLANLLVDGDTVKVIDFDDCGFSWFLYDAATPVSFYEHHPEVPDLLRHWAIGYRRAAPLSQSEEAEIPTFVMLRRLLLVAWIGSHAQTDLARTMGDVYTAGTVGLSEDFLARSA
jgi:Ser/Thr protein kinase RdoA (MazF antagonist)